VGPDDESTAATEHRLAVSARGDGPTLAIVHGFAQDRRCIGPLAGAVADRRVLLVDAPGHGGSWRHAGADLEQGAELLANTTGPCVLVGYSMGGRLALVTALTRPDVVEALVLIGATAGIEDDHERAERRRHDHELADRLERIGVQAFVDEWLSSPMFAGLAPWARFEDERRANRTDALASSLRRAGTGSMRPRWQQLRELDIPVLCITGERDTRYGELARRMVTTFGERARHHVVAGAGHAAHLEAPTETSRLLRDFVAELR
jgi:2-succinyl-6-hydroxy-2,4-cyclohexadiene-1-carboxylate synthase